MYYAMQLLANVNFGLGIANMWNIATFLSQIVSTAALLGLLFQFPIVLTFLIKFNILNVKSLRSKRSHAVLGMFVFASLLPPTDGLSLILMVLPLILMYEITILYNRGYKSD
jgi:sec-independent protein translocase protein TatC